MVLKKRPRCVPVFKYKLKTKKAAARRVSIVSDLIITLIDWYIER